MIGDDSGGVTLYTFNASGWHICDGSLRCHTALDIHPNMAKLVEEKYRRRRQREDGVSPRHASRAGAKAKRRTVPTYRQALKDLAHPIQPVRFLAGSPCGHNDHVVQADVSVFLPSVHHHV